MNVRPLARGEDAAWDEFVHANSRGTLFHTTAWRDLVARHSGHRSLYLVAAEGAAIRGVLPLFLVKSPFLGTALVSVPWAVYGGIAAADPEAEGALLAAARASADQAGARYVELRNLGGRTGELPASDLYVTFLRDLPADPEACLELIPRKSRASTRHARDKHGMEFEGGRQYLDAFYDLFVTNKQDLGSPVFARSWFADLLERFGDGALLHVVRHQGVVVAAVFSFVHRGVLMPYYSGSNLAAERLGSMNFMYWKLMEEGVRLGLQRFDFGRSRADSGACSFKKNMGFEPTPLDYQYDLRGGAKIPSVNPGNPRFDFVKRAWAKLPVGVVKWLGPRLMRYLP